MIYRRVSECIQPSTPSAINHTEASIEECSDFFCALNNRFSIFSVVWHLPGTYGNLMFVKNPCRNFARARLAKSLKMNLAKTGDYPRTYLTSIAIKAFKV